MCVISGDRLLCLEEVMALTKISSSKIYRDIRDGTFPTPIKVGARAVRWWLSEIEAWLASRPRATGEMSP